MGRFNLSGNYCREFANNSVISAPEDNLHLIIDSQCGIRCSRSISGVQTDMRWVKPSPGMVSNIRITNDGSYSDLLRTTNLQSDFNGVYTCTSGNSVENVLHIGLYVDKPGIINMKHKFKPGPHSFNKVFV